MRTARRIGAMLCCATLWLALWPAPASGAVRIDPNDVPGDRYDVAASSVTIRRIDGVRWITVTIQTYEGFALRTSEGAFAVRLDTWGAERADFVLRMFGDAASGGGLFATLSSTHGPSVRYAAIEKEGPKHVSATFPVHWVHPTKTVRWLVVGASPIPWFHTGDPVIRDRAPNVGWYAM
jgi:hypothetical protein